MTKLYLLSFDPFSPAADVDGLHATIVGSESILNWAHYHAGCYFLTSDLDAARLTELVRHHFGAGGKKAASFVISEIGADNTNGMLPSPAWTWLGKRRDEILKTNDRTHLQPAGE